MSRQNAKTREVEQPQMYLPSRLSRIHLEVKLLDRRQVRHVEPDATCAVVRLR